MKELKFIGIRLFVAFGSVILIVNYIAMTNKIEALSKPYFEIKHLATHKMLKEKAMSEDPWEKETMDLLSSSQIMLGMKDRDDYPDLVNQLVKGLKKILLPKLLRIIFIIFLVLLAVAILLFKLKNKDKPSTNLKDENLEDESMGRGRKKTPTNRASRLAREARDNS